ncbi:MAG: FtsX-like permease family protein [Muribaculaceae bacterium]
MKRSLLKQMCNEWRGNLWVIAGLTVVSSAVWILCAQLYGILRPTFYPMGFEDEGLYIMSVHDVPEGESNKSGQDSKALADRNGDLRALLKEFRENPNVEVAGLSMNGTPYQRSWYASLWLAEEPDTTGYSGYTKFMTPEMVRVLGLRSSTGKSTEELEAVLRKGEVLITTRPGVDEEVAESGGYLPAAMIGKKVTGEAGGTSEYVVGDVVDVMRESMFYRPMGTIIKPLAEENPYVVGEIAVRVKPGMGEAFMDDFESKGEMQERGCIYLSAPDKVTYRRMSAEQSEIVSTRLYVSLICFIFIIIFLGLLGSFWFRVQQSTGEIAIRKVCGASRRAIFHRIIGEGMILLLVATALAAAAAWTIIFKSDPGEDHMPALIIELLTFVIVSVCVVVSLWWPARRAMRIEPAIAIKDE